VSHLGRWLSAQVDGELDGVERDRVLNHLAGCEACRREANALRALKRRMTALSDPESDTAIAGRLIERARSKSNLAPEMAGMPHWPSPAAGPWPGQSWPRLAKPGWRIVTGSAGTALIAIGLLAFLLGGGRAAHPIPRVSPAVDSYWTQHSYDTGNTPVTGAVLVQSLLPTSHLRDSRRHTTSASSHDKVRKHHSLR
jgi:anti-sigma factor RsiW